MGIIRAISSAVAFTEIRVTSFLGVSPHPGLRIVLSILMWWRSSISFSSAEILPSLAGTSRSVVLRLLFICGLAGRRY